MRQLKHNETGQILTVTEFFMTKNMWEYFVLKTEDGPENTDEVKFCYVMGIEDEMGDVYMPEVTPHIMLRTQNLEEVLPPTGYQWVTNA